MFKYFWAKFFKKIHGKAIKNSIIHSSSKIEAGSEVINTKMDKHSFCGYFCELNNVEIGSFCSIANNVKIGGGMHPIEWVSTSPVFYEGRDSVKAKFSEHKRENHLKTFINNDVWIGSNVIIKQGVRIGTGAVIGMGSVVTKDVEPYSIVGGIPAKEIRKRFDQETIDALLSSEWWNLPDSELIKHAEYFTNPQLFIEKLRK